MIARSIAQELKFIYPRILKNLFDQKNRYNSTYPIRRKITSKNLYYLVHSRKKKINKEKLPLNIPFDNSNHFTGVKNRFELRSKTVLRSSRWQIWISRLSRLCPGTRWWVGKDIMTDKQGRGWRTAFLFPPGMAHGGWTNRSLSEE